MTDEPTTPSAPDVDADLEDVRRRPTPPPTPPRVVADRALRAAHRRG